MRKADRKGEEYVRSIPDFPEPGIISEISPRFLQDPDGLHLPLTALWERLEGS